MNETIISNWNRMVGPEDIVFHLGDFCLGGSAEWINILNRLNGKIYLISGNHDIKNLRQNYTKYFEQIAMQMYIEVDKQKIYLNHCPFLCYDGSYDVGVDNNDFTPVSFAQVKAIIGKQIEQSRKGEQ